MSDAEHAEHAELADQIAALGVTYDMWWGDVADRILPLIAERDTRIAELEAELRASRAEQEPTR